MLDMIIEDNSFVFVLNTWELKSGPAVSKYKLLEVEQLLESLSNR